MSTPEPPALFPYEGPPALRERVEQALTRVVDPEVAMNIVDVGLVCGVTATDGKVQVRLTMTSAACPMADLIVEEAQAQLEHALPGSAVEIELVWEPPWSTERMSARAKRFMGW